MDVMERRRMLLTADNLLPPIYRKVEYLEATNGQYLSIPITNAVINTPFEITCQAFDNDGTGVLISFGASTGGNWFGSTSGNYSVGGGNNLTNVVLGEKITATVTRETNRITVECNGQTIRRSESSHIGSVMGLFADAMRNSYYSHARYYSVVSDGIINLIPCIRVSDTKPGMYDVVSKVFYTNAGTGEFIVL